MLIILLKKLPKYSMARLKLMRFTPMVLAKVNAAAMFQGKYTPSLWRMGKASTLMPYITNKFKPDSVDILKLWFAL